MFGIGKIMKTVPMQTKFETRVSAGQTLTIPQLKQMGFANPYDAAYSARQNGFNVQRFMKNTRKGPVSVYSLDV
jgi:hypothetical protein